VQVGEIGEQGLLKRLKAFCPADVVGDDAAVLALLPGRSLVVTTDMLVENIHFSDRTTAPEDIGWRATAANLSDLAAMGAEPLGLTLALGVPATTEVAWLERLYQGMTDCLYQYGTVLVGGDICRSSVVTLSITACGQVQPERVILRSTAQPGDQIVVTGVHGASRAGLELLLHPDWGQELAPSDRLTLIQAHQRPQPRLDVISLLRHQPHFPRIAGMDSSDGLADAVIQICQASGVGARVWRDRIPLPAAFSELIRLVPTFTAEQALAWALYGGEDFELVLCLKASAAQELIGQLGQGAAIVGEIIAEPGINVVDAGVETPLTMNQAFQHFA
jgi:thiamine-monophosphate kinase